ncbi:unnamed protein product, partial [marine sediment metagenome]
NSRSTSGVNKPEYRDWAEDVEETVTTKHFHEYIRAIVDLLLKEVGQNLGARLPDLIANFNSYTDDQLKIVVEHMLGIDPCDLQDGDREISSIDQSRSACGQPLKIPFPSASKS